MIDAICPARRRVGCPARPQNICRRGRTRVAERRVRVSRPISGGKNDRERLNLTAARRRGKLAFSALSRNSDKLKLTQGGLAMRIDVHAHLFSKGYIEALRRGFGNHNSPAASA